VFWSLKICGRVFHHLVMARSKLEHPGTPGSSLEYQEHWEEITGFLLMYPLLTQDDKRTARASQSSDTRAQEAAVNLSPFR
jgi:hypothetical protein